MLCLKIAGLVPNIVDPDVMPHSVASHLGLHCLLRPICLNTYGKYGNMKRYSKYSKSHAKGYSVVSGQTVQLVFANSASSF